MLVSAIIISALIILALLRFGFIAEYSDAGFNAWAKVAFLKFQILGNDKKKKAKKKPKKKKPKKQKEKKSVSLSAVNKILKAVKKALYRLRRRLLINKLTLYYTSAGDDPSKTAILYGAANAGLNTVIPVLERYLRIRRRDLRVFVDFTATQQTIYVKLNISIAVWEVFYIAFALFPIITAFAGGKPKDKTEDSEPKDKTEDTERKHKTEDAERKDRTEDTERKHKTEDTERKDRKEEDNGKATDK